MTSKKELIVVVSNGYQPVNESLMSKSPGLTSDKILLLSDEFLLKGEDKKKKILFIKVVHQISYLKKQSQLPS